MENKMNIINDIDKLKNDFKALTNTDANCVKLGKREIWELENWYNQISKPESIAKKVKINDGAVIMGMRIVKTKNRNFLEVGVENFDSEKWKTIILNPKWKARVEINDEKSNA